jgi:penicillin-binding protein 1A
LPKKLPTRNPVYRTLWTLDSYVSSGVFETWDFLKRAGSAYSSFLCRFRLSGPKRLVADVADDFATFGVVAAFALMAYALPPFSGTDDVWNRGRDYAITFTDQQGDVIGQRGIRQDDAIPLEELSPHLIKAVLATEDARFFDHFGVDLIGTLRASCRTPGRVACARAVHRSPSRLPRTCSSRQSARCVARCTRRSCRCGSRLASPSRKS